MSSIKDLKDKTYINSSFSPIPKPDFSFIEQKESSVNYHTKGSYKKKKQNFPESPMKQNKFYTPFKPLLHNNNNLDTEVSKKLFFGTDDVNEHKNISMSQFKFSNESKNKVTNKKLIFDNTITEEEENPISRQVTSGFNGSPIRNISSFNLMENKSNEKNYEDKYKLSMQRSNITNVSTGNDFNNMQFDFEFSLGKKFSFEMKDKIIGMTNGKKGFVSNFNDKATNLSFFNKKATSEESLFEKSFSIIKTLDEGSFGKVYLCRENISQNLYAVKMSKKTKNQ